MNRMTRDELLHGGLDQADLASLDQHDRPHGVIVEGAYSISWLQQGLDWFHQAYPWAALIKTATLAIVANVDTYELPTDYVQDVRDGLILQDGSNKGRVRRRGLTNILDGQVSLAPGQTLTQRPAWYSVHSLGTTQTAASGFPKVIQVFPMPDRAYTGTLYYYALPNVLIDGAVVPVFPSDYILIEYLRIRGLEWGRQLPVGTHMEFAKKALGDLQSSGFGREAEDNVIPLDPSVFRKPVAYDRNSWLGATTVG